LTGFDLKAFNHRVFCMSTVYDVKAEPLIEEVAEELEESFEAPDWTNYVKTGAGKDRPPQQDNWYHVRSAAILRRIYTDGPLGVSRLRTFSEDPKATVTDLTTTERLQAK